MSIYKQVVSCFPGVLLTVLARSAENFKAFPQLTHSHTPLHKLQCFFFFPSSLLVTPFHSFSLFHSPHHLYSWRPNSEHRNEMLHRPRGACFLPADTKEAITARRGQIGWGSYLGRIMFDILHHYQLPPSPPQESYLSLADVPLSVMNFLCPPSASPPPAHPTSQPPHLLLRGCSRGKKKKGGERRGNKKKREVIDARCHCKQNGKYNLAFSLCGDNGANTRRQRRHEQTAWLVIRQECFGTIWSTG